jgi:cytochrome c2
MTNDAQTPKYIYAMQILSISLIWVFVAGITWWIIRLITLSLELHDEPDLSFAISIIVIPTFFILAGVLTYVFIGLQRNREPQEDEKNGHAGASLALALFILAGSFAYAAPSDIPANPLAGRIVFEKKGCTDCHGIHDFGEKTGPDLGREKIFDSFYDVASRLWNHAPRMELQSGSLSKKWPTMDKAELNRLIGFLYFLRYLGEPGDVDSGKKLIRRKTCLNCHRIGKEGAPGGITLDQLSQYASPLYVAQVIWNHGLTMQDRMAARGIKRPNFNDGDIADISAYLREYSRGQSVKLQFMSPGNPEAGKKMFRDKGCARCHAVTGGKASVGPALNQMDLHRSVTSIAARMWNHGGQMGELMKEQNIRWPVFKESQMADLIAYLYFYNYYGYGGNAARGKQVFISKSCIKCHGRESPLHLGKDNPLTDPGDLVRTMWNHVPYMREVTITKNIEWPKLSETELRHLYAYLLKQSKQAKK